jgi:Flp pilus assembly protein TadB
MRSSDFILPLVISLYIGGILYFLLSYAYQRSLAKAATISQFSMLQDYSIENKLKFGDSQSQPSFTYRFIPVSVRKYVKDSLELIHTSLKYEIVMTQLLLCAALITLLFTLASGSIYISIILGLLLTPLIFRQIIKSILRREREEFREDLPDLLNILAGGLRAGLSLHQALEAYTSENQGEVSIQIRRALSEMSIGSPIDTALMGVANRMQSEDLKWTVTALTIQKTVGGSMATILETAFDTVKGRADINREIRTISAEGRLSAYVLMALPFGIFAFLFLTRREYVRIFWTDAVGLAMLAFICASLIFGWIWIRKVVEIRI